MKHHNATHGMTKSPEFNIWSHMLGRCNNPNNKSYVHYGGRGISVCESWKKFENFYRDMGPRPGAGYSIDRVDVNGDYCPDNCRWATAVTQARNTRKTKYVTAGGKTLPFIEMAEDHGITRETLKSRVCRGMSIEDAIAKPVVRHSGSTRGRLYEFNSKHHSAAEWSAITGIPYKTLLHRLHAGWDIGKALTTRVKGSSHE